jgi:hypothetical protein
MEQERRRTPRFSFIAHAELREDASQVRVVTRVNELSLNGCYLDMMNPFPAGTMVTLRIVAGEETFETHGKIIYSQPNIGAGVIFLDVDPKYQPVLRHWLEVLGSG